MASNKLPPSGHIVYDSGNDTSTGKKRAVLPGGGVSVAERARLFGTQVTSASAPKTQNSTYNQIQRPPINNQSTKSNVIRQEGNYQSPRIDTDQRPKQNTTYSQRTPTNYRPAEDIRPTTKHEQVSTVTPRTYSKATQPNYPNPHSPARQRPVISYDTFKHISPQRQPSTEPKPTQLKPSELHSSDGGTYSTAYNRQKSVPYNQKSSNYFRPIQDPLDVLFRDAPQEYIQQQAPITIGTNIDGMQPFDLGSLINRIQQDYVDNARPYVSSVQFIQQGGGLSNLGFLTPATNRKDYTRRPSDINNRQVPLQHYDIIDTNGYYPHEQMNPRRTYNDDHYSSISRRRQHRHYHNQATSPIHIFESSDKVNMRSKPESKPVTPVPKVPTPVAVSSSEEEEEEEEVKQESSSEEESESEEESTIAQPPPLPPSLVINETVRAPNPIGTPTTQPNGVARTALPNQPPLTTARAPAKASESEESDSEESDSEEDSESDDEDAKKPKPKPIPPARQNAPRAVPSTPQTAARGTPQRGNLDTQSINQPPESYHSVGSFDLQEPSKPSSIGGKLKSIFRRNKS